MRIITIIAAAALLSLATAQAGAQICRGGVAFGSALAQGQIRVEVDNKSSLFVAGAGLGGQRYYGVGTLGVRTYEAREGNTFIAEFSGGRSFSLPLTGTVVHCGEISALFGTGPDQPGAIRADESSSSMTFGLFSGLPLRGSGALTVTPFAGLAARYESIVVQGESSSVAENDFYELAILGVGLRLRDGASLQTFAQFSLGRDVPSDPTFGMRLSINVGARN